MLDLMMMIGTREGECYAFESLGQSNDMIRLRIVRPLNHENLSIFQGLLTSQLSHHCHGTGRIQDG